MKGNEAGLEPVAIMLFFDSMVSLVPSFLVILIEVGLSNEPTPSKTVLAKPLNQR
jgi:hypothetical protein